MIQNMIKLLCIFLLSSRVFSFHQKFNLPFTSRVRIPKEMPNKNYFILQCQSSEFSPMDTENRNIENINNNNNEGHIENEYETLLNRCCGEVNETDELEELEREFFEIYQKMKKYNKKRIFQTKQDIYKLFRRFN